MDWENKLNEYKIPSSIHYPVPLNKQPAFATEEFNLDFSNIISDKVMSIPMHPYLLENDQQKIVKKCAEIINKKIK